VSIFTYIGGLFYEYSFIATRSHILCEQARKPSTKEAER